MKIFLDTAEVADIQRYAAWGIVGGVTTNPTLIAKSGRVFEDVVREICGLVDGPVSAEVTALEARVTGLDWTFAPTLAVPQDDRWGRTYEGYSEDPAIVASYARTPSSRMIEAVPS